MNDGQVVAGLFALAKAHRRTAHDCRISSRFHKSDAWHWRNKFGNGFQGQFHETEAERNRELASIEEDKAAFYRRAAILAEATVEQGKKDRWAKKRGPAMPLYYVQDSEYIPAPTEVE